MEKKSFAEIVKEFNEKYPDAFDWAFWYEKEENKLIDPQEIFEEYGLALYLTCGACPEQYDVYLNGTETQVGYLRLRHGNFRVDFPDCGGETIYTASPIGDGVFEDNERMKYLTEALNAILKKLNSEQNDERSVATESQSRNDSREQKENENITPAVIKLDKSLLDQCKEEAAERYFLEADDLAIFRAGIEFVFETALKNRGVVITK